MIYKLQYPLGWVLTLLTAVMPSSVIADHTITQDPLMASNHNYYWATLVESDSTIECTDSSNDPSIAKILKISKAGGLVMDEFTFPIGTGRAAGAGIAVGPEFVWFTSPSTNEFGRIRKSELSGHLMDNCCNATAEYFSGTGLDKPYGIAVGIDKVWITHQDSERVASYSRTSGEEIDNIDYGVEGIVGRVPWGVAVDSNSVWVTNHGSLFGTDSVIQINRQTGVLIREILIEPHINSISPRATVAGIYSDGDFLWLPTNELVPTTNNVSVSGLSGTLIKFDIDEDVNFPVSGDNRLVIGDAPIYITGNNSRVWVTHAASNTVVAVDKATMAVIDDTSLGTFQLSEDTLGRGISYSNGNSLPNDYWFNTSVATVQIGDRRTCSDTPDTKVGLKLKSSQYGAINLGGNTAPSFGDMSGWLYDHSFGTLTQSFFMIAASSCQAVNPGDSIRLQTRETGLTNTETDRSIPVVCPINREVFNQFSSANNDRIVLKLQAESAGDMDVSMHCSVNSYKGISEVTVTTVGTLELPLQKAIPGELKWDLQESIDSLGSITITCDLPPKTAIISIETRADFGE